MDGNRVRERLHQSAEALRNLIAPFPRKAIVLGSGLGHGFRHWTIEREIPYSHLPNFAPVSAPGHKGAVLIARTGDESVILLSGRIHLYEGHAMEQVVLPVRSLALAGCETFILTNAAGAINPKFKAGDLVKISDHLNLMNANPLTGANQEELGPRFPDMTTVYDAELRARMDVAASKLGITIHEGVYAALAGPSYETPMEIRMLRTLGADLVGMSTVPEAIALRHMGKRVCALSFVSNEAAGMSGQPLAHDEVLRTAEKSSDRLASLLGEVLS